MTIVEGLLLLVYTVYAIFMIWLASGWRNRRRGKITVTSAQQGVTIVVPVRNEAVNITKCLKALSNQRFSKNQYEVIVVDDHSEDATIELIEKARKQHTANIRVMALEKGIEGKKKAIAKAIEAANFDRIITVDADCTMKEEWLNTMVEFWDATHAKMIIGPVKYHPLKSAFERLQACDFATMVSFGAATCFHNRPTICNGANLGFNAVSFAEVGGYKGNEQFASGDDVFLLHKMKKHYPNEIHFIDNTSAMVYTEPCSDWNSFVAQRVRWAEKGRRYRDPFTVLVSLLLLITQSALLLSAWLLCSDRISYTGLLMVGITIKLFVDYYFIYPYIRFFGMKNEAIYFLFIQLLYPFYLLLIVIFAPFYQFSWKGRTPQLKIEKTTT